MKEVKILIFLYLITPPINYFIAKATTEKRGFLANIVFRFRWQLNSMTFVSGRSEEYYFHTIFS